MDIKNSDKQKNELNSSQGQNSEEETIFTKENIKYDVNMKLPDGTFILNYDNDQYPLVPFAHYKLKYKKKEVINHLNEEEEENNKFSQNELLNKNLLDSQKEKNGSGKNIDLSNLEKKLDDLKEDLNNMNREGQKNKRIFNRNNRNSKYQGQKASKEIFDEINAELTQKMEELIEKYSYKRDKKKKLAKAV